jgi:hypothetical protein
LPLIFVKLVCFRSSGVGGDMNVCDVMAAGFLCDSLYSCFCSLHKREHCLDYRLHLWALTAVFSAVSLFDMNMQTIFEVTTFGKMPLVVRFCMQLSLGW